MSDKSTRYDWTRLPEFKVRYENGESSTKLAKEVGCTPPTLLRQLAKAGTTIRPKGRPKVEKVEEAPAVTPLQDREVETSVEKFTEDRPEPRLSFVLPAGATHEESREW